MTTNTNKYNREYYEENKEKERKRKRDYMRKHRKENPEIHRKKSRDAKTRLRNKLYKMYGDTCTMCGFSDKRALTLDHIKNNGAEERKEMGPRGPWYRAVGEYLPDDYRILCMNCQFIARVEANRQNQW